MTSCSDLQLGFKLPLSSSHNCPSRGFAFSFSLSSFRQMSVFFFKVALWEFLEINKQTGEGNPLWAWRLWVRAVFGVGALHLCSLALPHEAASELGALLSGRDPRQKFIPGKAWCSDVYEDCPCSLKCVSDCHHQELEFTEFMSCEGPIWYPTRNPGPIQALADCCCLIVTLDESLSEPQLPTHKMGII